MIKTAISNQTSSHQSGQIYPNQNGSFQNSQFELSDQNHSNWVDGSGKNSYSIHSSQTTPFLSKDHFQDISHQQTHLNRFVDANLANTGACEASGALGAAVSIPTKQFTPQYITNSYDQFQTAAVGFPVLNGIYGTESNTYGKAEQNYDEQAIKQNLNGVINHQNQPHFEQQKSCGKNGNQVSEMNQLQALRNLIQNMQSNGGNNNHTSVISSPSNKLTNHNNTILSNNGISGLRAPQQQKYNPHVLDNQNAGKLSSNIVSNQLEHVVIPSYTSELYNIQSSLSSSNIPMQVNYTSQDVNCNSIASNLHSNINQIPNSFHQLSSSISNSYQGNYLPLTPSLSPSEQKEASQSIYENYQKCLVKKQPPKMNVESLDVSKDQSQSVNEPTSFLTQLVTQQSCLDINSQLKQLQQQLQSNSYNQSHKQVSPTTQLQSQSKNNTINGVNDIANFQARNQNQQELKKHILRNLTDKNKELSQSSSHKNSPKSSQSDNETIKVDKKRDIKANSKKQSGYTSGDSSSSSNNSSAKSSQKNEQTNNYQGQTKNPEQIAVHKDIITTNTQSSLYDTIENKGQKRNHTQMLQAPGAQTATKTKYQMVDHSTEQKKQRLNNGSFRQNDIFHTSGNRYVPTIPKSILGGSNFEVIFQSLNNDKKSILQRSSCNSKNTKQI